MQTGKLSRDVLLSFQRANSICSIFRTRFVDGTSVVQALTSADFKN